MRHNGHLPGAGGRQRRAGLPQGGRDTHGFRHRARQARAPRVHVLQGFCVGRGPNLEERHEVQPEAQPHPPRRHGDAAQDAQAGAAGAEPALPTAAAPSRSGCAQAGGAANAPDGRRGGRRGGGAPRRGGYQGSRRARGSAHGARKDDRSGAQERRGSGGHRARLGARHAFGARRRRERGQRGRQPCRHRVFGHRLGGRDGRAARHAPRGAAAAHAARCLGRLVRVRGGRHGRVACVPQLDRVALPLAGAAHARAARAAAAL
mmetsp:Transcript_394/g.1119  ORF Transcript_394/g.1119 Transcript_394/m.1119 type:complete len:262 (-) Transcript_394:352-1137(-)